MSNDAPESPLRLDEVEESYAGTSGGAGVDAAFVPTDMDDPSMPAPESDPPSVKLIERKDLVDKAMAAIKSYYSRYTADRGDMEKLWNDIDYMWKCAKNSAKRDAKTNQNDANRESTTHAQTGSTLFYKQTTRLATQTLSVLFGKPEPFRYRPLHSGGAFLKEEEGRAMAEQHNALAGWNHLQDGFEQKVIDGITLLNKYGNLPIAKMWKRKMGARWVKRPIRGELTPDGELPQIAGYDLTRHEFPVENHLSLQFWPNENFYADRHIGTIQAQNCVMARSLSNLCAFYDGARAGIYDNVEKLKPDLLYRGEYETTLHAERQENVGLNAGDDTQTGQFEQWDVWIRLPIDEETQTWDESKNYPRIYWLTLVGTLRGGEPVCVRFDRNPDPNDEIPWEMLHQFPDDSDSLYHLSSAQIVQSNYDELTTAKNQAIDNRTLHNRKPLKAVYGEIYSENLKFEQNNVIYVERMDSLGEFTLADITGTIMSNIDYLEQDSNRALNTDRPIEGMPLGQRTSASEAVNVYEQAKMPHLITARYQLNQLLKFYGNAIPAYWHLFALPGQIVEISGETERREIKADTLWGDYEVVVDVVEEAANDAVRQQSIDFALQNFSQNPAFARHMDFPELLKEWFITKKWSNAARFVKNPTDFDAQRVARMEQEIMVETENPVYIEPSPTENKAAHLKEHKMYLAQFDHIENADVQYPGLVYMRQHTQMTEMGLQNDAMQQQAPQAQMPQADTAGQMQGNQLAAQQGAMAQMGG